MKVNAINNTNFKGLFVNKTSENGGNWRMEYHPYSWERKNPYCYSYETILGMSNQTSIDIKAKDLPDNEKIYNESRRWAGYREERKESCKDILDTEFYFCDYTNNITRKTITEMPAMSLEDSLRVKIKKLTKFISLKNDHRATLESEINDAKKEVDSHNSAFNDASNEYNKGYFNRSESKDSYKGRMSTQQWLMHSSVNQAFNKMKEYFQFCDDIMEVVDLRQKLTEEADKLTQARETGNLIDISRRDIYDPNKPLWDSIQEMIRTKTLEASKKLVALPHRAISMQEIIKALGDKVKGSEASAEIIKYVDKLIASRA